MAMFIIHRAQQGIVLGPLRGRRRGSGEWRRTHPRLVSSTPACLSWTEDETTWYVPARLVNICRTGAALITTEPLSAPQTVSVRLTGEEPTQWIEAELLGVERKEMGNYRVRVKFRRLCPDSFLQAAILTTAPSSVPSPAEGMNPSC